MQSETKEPTSPTYLKMKYTLRGTNPTVHGFNL